MTEAHGNPAARVIAFYLPQFHPIEENDEWWGKGFTEWTNVAKAKPLYWGHQQPRLPSDLGFYDLRVSETREAQAQLARSCGVEGFCYWHYWFGNGRRIMERPFSEVLTSGRPDFPFCLAWANHSWTAIWSGHEKRLLIEQKYPGCEDERKHFEALLPAFRDPRHMHVEGKPIFVIFRPWEVPDTAGFIGRWRKLATDNGLQGLYFVAMSNDFHDPCLHPFDAVTSIPPHDFVRQRSLASKIRGRLWSRNFGKSVNRWLPNIRVPERIDYRNVVRQGFSMLPDDPRCLPCAFPNWDNTPRSGVRGVVFENATPTLFQQYLSKAIEKVSGRPQPYRIVFLKAWNEWAEGNFVEPGLQFGSGFLDAIRSALF